MFTAILEAIIAIPKLISQIQELIGYFKKADEEKWFQNLHETMQALKQAETMEDKNAAAKAIQDSIRNL